jgi:very-short-patch-repair endonuclease
MHAKSTRRTSDDGVEPVNRVRHEAREGVDWAIAKLATRQHGVVSRTQLLTAGVTRHEIEWRLATGRLHAVHRGVYRVGHRAPGARAPEMAAALACGAGAVVSHRSAAYLWQLLPYPANPPPVDIMVAGRRVRRPRIRIHRVHALDDRDTGLRDRVPITVPARTLLDLASDLPIHLLERTIAEAQVRRLVRKDDLVDQLARNPGRPGTPALRTLVGRRPALTRSAAERRMLALVRAADLPTPLVNARIGRYEVDFLWRAERLAVEVDGYAYHSNRRAFERDRAKDAALAASGHTVLRVTWRQLTRAPETVVARLAAALAARR